METITLYRVEQPTGYGPYCKEDLPRKARDTVQRLGWRHADRAHPAPFEDDALYYGPSFTPGGVGANRGNVLGWGDLRYQDGLDEPDAALDVQRHEFAFETLAALKTWFGAYRDVRALAALKCVLVKVTVPRNRAILGSTQAVYHRDYADKDLLGTDALMDALTTEVAA